MTSTPRTSHRIHGPTLWAALDKKRRAEGLSWRGVARITGCTTGALFTRLQRDDIGLHSHALVSLLVWLGRDEQIRDLIVDASPTTGERGRFTAVDRLAAALADATASDVQEAFHRMGATVHLVEEPQP
ncbi:hypothetical protein [Streptomyces sp. LS1784]|uniref:hypothetical protein n=1 Tax=Streptomyces sp. LS1784 TaxID=2851533 RepID=UPI001CCD22F9|nr:hypothetical protein [Streptomyces sp. LS1784]